jgi:hypothetical protein
MSEPDHNLTRYLLGELSESERATLEEKYFSDPRVFEQVLKSESELVDGYVRGKLSPRAQERFEQIYLTNPRRRERVKFAGALVSKIDQTETAENVAAKPVWPVSGWRILTALPGRRPILEFSLALASLLLVIGCIWFFIDSRRLREELAKTQSARGDQEARTRELERQVAAERKRTEELTAQLDRGRPHEQAPAQAVATPPSTSALPTFASLVLTVSGVRGTETGRAPTLVIPAEIAEARLQLNLKEHDYTGYSVSLRAVGGPEIFNREGLKPRTTKNGASFTLIVPASKFATGDYILTLRGIRDGVIEDLSKSIFRVEKR